MLTSPAFTDYRASKTYTAGTYISIVVDAPLLNVRNTQIDVVVAAGSGTVAPTLVFPVGAACKGGLERAITVHGRLRGGQQHTYADRTCPA